MNRKRITVPATEIKRRCICRQCGRNVYAPEPIRNRREKGKSAHQEEETHCEHIYPHPDTWEP